MQTFNISLEDLKVLSVQWAESKAVVAASRVNGGKPKLADLQRMNADSEWVEESVMNPVNNAWNDQFEASMAVSEKLLADYNEIVITRDHKRARQAHDYALKFNNSTIELTQQVSELIGQLIAETITLEDWALAHMKINDEMQALIDAAEKYVAFDFA